MAWTESSMQGRSDAQHTRQQPSSCCLHIQQQLLVLAHPVRRQSEISIEAQPDSRKATAAQQRLLATAAAAK